MKINMKQTLEEVAKENILFNHRTVDRTLSGSNLAQFGITNFIQGAEWQAKQSPWVSVKDRLPRTDDDLYIVLDAAEKVLSNEDYFKIVSQLEKEK